MSIDSYLVDKLDRAMTWVQKRGVSLCRVHIFTAGMTLCTTVTSATGTIGLVICGSLWGSYLYFTIRWANRNADYQTDWRKLNALNAVALHERETCRLPRQVWLWSSILFFVSDLVGYFFFSRGDALLPHMYSDFAFTCAAMTCWLNAASFVGFQASTKREAGALPQGAGA